MCGTTFPWPAVLPSSPPRSASSGAAPPRSMPRTTIRGSPLHPPCRSSAASPKGSHTARFHDAVTVHYRFHPLSGWFVLRDLYWPCREEYKHANADRGRHGCDRGGELSPRCPGTLRPGSGAASSPLCARPYATASANGRSPSGSRQGRHWTGRRDRSLDCRYCPAPRRARQAGNLARWLSARAWARPGHHRAGAAIR